MTVADHAPFPAVSHVLLRDGRIASLQPLSRADEPDLRSLNKRVSPHTRLMRFFSVSDHPGEWYVDKLLEQAPGGNALVARIGGELVAVASFARLEDDPTVADLGMLVDDEHQGSGIGALLLEHLAHAARTHGVTSLRADVLSENHAMITLLRTSGLDIALSTDGPLTIVRIDTFEGVEAQRVAQEREIVSERASLAPLLAPASCAVVGSSREGTVGSRVVRALREYGYTGQLHVVDRPGGLLAVGRVDLVIVCVPVDHVLEVAKDAAAVRAAGLLVLSAGFAESGTEGRRRQDELLDYCRTAGMRLIGPNCLGVVNTDPALRMNATFCETEAPPGGIALLSQSGAVGIAALRHAEQRRAGLSLFVSTGNKADVSGNDLLEYLAADERTRVVAMYLESFGNPTKFARLVRRLSATKPVVVVKSGRSRAGARAGQSHTAAAATPDAATDALLRAAGAVRADDLTELFDVATVLEAAPLPRGCRVAVIGNSGGPGVLAVDALETAGLEVVELPEGTQRELRRLVPASASVQNPVDLLATVTPDQLQAAVALLLAEESVDAVISVYTPVSDGSEQDIANALVAARDQVPDVPLLATFPGLAAPPAALTRDGNATVPFFTYPEHAAKVLAKVVEFAQWRRSTGDHEVPDVRPVCSGHLEALLAHKAGPSRWLAPDDVDVVLRALDVPVVPGITATDAARAVAAAEVVGYPVVMKASGPEIVHKTDIGGVVTGLRDAADVRRAYVEMARRVGDAMTGALVQRQLRTDEGLELLVGGYRDPSVGPLVMVGLGGTMTDVLADRVLRLPPATREEALAQVEHLRCAPALHGFRGRGALDLGALADVMVRVGRLFTAYPEVHELDINPLLVLPDGAWALDARIAVAPPDDGPTAPFRALRPPLAPTS